MRRLLPLLFLLSGPAFAAPATSAADPAAGLGRLFYSAERRATLDTLRNRNIDPAAPATQAREMRLDGIVQRSDGRSTLWLNGSPVYGRAPVSSFDSRSARIVIGAGKTADVPVGGSVQMVSDAPAP